MAKRLGDRPDKAGNEGDVCLSDTFVKNSDFMNRPVSPSTECPIVRFGEIRAMCHGWACPVCVLVSFDWFVL